LQACHYLQAFFEQHGTRLPIVTQQVLSISERMNSHWLLIIPGLIVIDGVVLLGLQLLKRPWRFLARVWFSAAILGAFVLVSWSLLVIAIPIDAILAPDQQVLAPRLVEP
jgi:type II secretory pathway component PulF